MSTGYQIYNQHGTYFLTFQIVSWADLFTRQVYRTIVTDSLNHCVTAKGLNIHGWVIMSNHLHCILSAQQGNLSAVIRDFKAHTAKAIWEQIERGPESRREWLQLIFQHAAGSQNKNDQFQIWTHENHAILLEKWDWFTQRLTYIHQNPVSAGIVTEPHHYTYSSAVDYATGHESGSLPITFLQH